MNTPPLAVARDTAPEAHLNCKDLRGADEADRMREALVRPKRIAGRLGIPGI
ncbi:MAG: hypothetical protein HC841_02900 [Verrucomicrobiae bacterium]|nr:hypothetical protein [Verrucomicrobiae bacterium]